MFVVSIQGKVTLGTLSHLVWKRMKDLLYLGSLHTGELPEFYGFTGNHVGMDAFGVHTFPPFSSMIPVADEDYTSQLHQPSKPKPPERFQRHKPVVKYHLAEIHPRQQGDLVVQRQCQRGVHNHTRHLPRRWYRSHQ